MDRYLIKLIIPCLFIIGNFTNSLGQNEEDSLVTEINELLSIEVNEERYISSASKYAQTPEEAPSSISIISSKEIRAYDYQNLPQLLNAQKGIYISDDRSNLNVGFRGFGASNNNRVLLLIDGHRLNPYQVDYAPILSFGLHLSNFEKVEIVRGPGSTLYGSNAVHGVINLITKKEKDSYIPIITANYGSNNSKYLGLRAHKKITEDLSVSLFGNMFFTDGENYYFEEYDQSQSNNGIVNNLDGEEYSGLLAKLNFKDISATFFTSKYNKDVPTAPLSTEFNAPQNRFINSHMLDISWSSALSFDKNIYVNIFYDFNEYGTNLPFSFISDDIEFFGKTNSYGAKTQFIWDILPNNRLITGIEYQDNFDSKYNYSIGNFELLDDKWSYKLFSLFFQNEFQLDASLSMYLGLRMDDFIGQDVVYNPRAGLVFTPFESHTFKLLYGQSFRAPNLIERNLEEKNIAGLKSNNALKSEIIKTTELIWGYSISHNLKTTVSLYNYLMTDLINQVEDPIDDLLQYTNVGEVTARGVEGELSYTFNTGSSYINYSYQNTTDINGNTIANSPTHLLKSGVRGKLYGLINGSFEWIYESKRLTLFGDYTSPVHLLNVNFYTDRILGYLSLSFSVKNLLDQTIKHPTSKEFIQHSIVQPYRNYMINLSLDF
ncbi:MAG: TonB-dependent receptor [Melioribacteraceae bacterium]|nr:TonB-dependent receptor [Melioribacteraceae bacterium]